MSPETLTLSRPEASDERWTYTPQIEDEVYFAWLARQGVWDLPAAAVRACVRLWG